MKLNLIYEHFSNKNTKSKDYFDLIVKKIDSTFVTQTSVNNQYLVVDPDNRQDYVDDNLIIFNIDGVEFVNISTLTVTFWDIPEDDRHQVRDDLIEMYGKRAKMCQLIEETEIEDGIPRND